MIEEKAMGKSGSLGANNTKRDCPDPLRISMDQFGIELIECARQPGKLKITKKACGKRYVLANTVEHRRPRGDFRMALQWSLGICKSCPEGCKNAQAFPRTAESRTQGCS
jgi:hypothetical protein